MTRPKWQKALIEAGHLFICHECKTPFREDEELKHVHDGKYYGEKIEPWRPYAIINSEKMTLEEFRKRTNWKGEPVFLEEPASSTR